MVDTSVRERMPVLAERVLNLTEPVSSLTDYLSTQVVGRAWPLRTVVRRSRPSR